jgi:bifunctional polynucleotide phosphatase/kinase
VLLDFDGTLITSRINNAQWRLSHPNVPRVLAELAAAHDLYIVSNQFGEKVNVEVALGKMAEFLERVGLDIPVYVATAKDQYRKPKIGIWGLIQADAGSHEYSDGLFVGDANGVDWKAFSDLLFAVNAQLRFVAPLALFDGSATFDTDMTAAYYARVQEHVDLVHKYVTPGYPRELSTQYDLVLMVGPPASTKSTYCTKTLPDYAVVNQDTLKTAAKCVKECERLLQDGFSVVVDNCNATKEARRKFLDIANAYDKSVACVFINVPKAISLHMNAYRSQTSDKRIPDIAIHKFYKSLEEPTAAEGFSEVLDINEIRLEYTDTLIYSYLS